MSSMFRHRVVASVSLICAALMGLCGATAVAATTAAPGAGNGMRISPDKLYLTIKPGASQTVDIYVTNLTGQPATLQGIADDFMAGSDENGSPAILLNGQKAPSHSLKDYVQPIPNFTLAAHAIKDVKVTIVIPAGTAGGGYFGVVRFEPTSSAGNKNVNIQASVGSLLLVTVPGKIVEQLSITSFDVRQFNAHDGTVAAPSTFFTNGKSLAAVVRFNNAGNLQEAPFGNILLKKGNRKIATYQINNTTPRGDVLPGSIRRFIMPLGPLKSFGRYTIEGNFGYGSTGQLLTAQTSFYVIPLSLMIGVIIVLAAVVLAIFVVPRLVRRYNQTIIRRANRHD